MLRFLAVALRNTYYRLTRKRTIGVVGLVLRENKVCLVKHSYAGGWYLPGGSMSRNETPYQAVVREVREETGVVVRSARLMNVYSHFSRGWSNYVLCYLIEEFDVIENATLDREISEAKFFEVAHLPEDVRPTAQRRIREAIEQKIPADPRW